MPHSHDSTVDIHYDTSLGLFHDPHVDGNYDECRPYTAELLVNLDDNNLGDDIIIDT